MLIPLQSTKLSRHVQIFELLDPSSSARGQTLDLINGPDIINKAFVMHIKSFENQYVNLYNTFSFSCYCYSLVCIIDSNT